ncbi:MAG: AarF/ABC1/UbiB kinase family protein [Peptococcaceae bacterium]
MRLFNVRRRKKHLKRYREIAQILSRHGFGHLLQILDLTKFLPVRPKKEGKSKRPRLSPAERLLLALEELGPTFIKLGQLLSTRTDLLPPAYIQQLQKLQDQLPPFPFDQVADCLEKELGQPYDNIFTQFSPVPIAAASIGQVHKAALKTGEEVAVKIKRPGIEKILATDIEILYDLAGFMDRYGLWKDMYNFREIVREFEHMLSEETNFILEGQHAQNFRAHFRNDSNVHIPDIYWPYTTPQILTMEFVNGIKLTDLEEINRQGLNRQLIAHRLINAYFYQIFIHGFFHADPHPGNLSVLPGERIVFMDFGIVGKLDDETRLKISDFILGLVQKDTAAIMRAADELGVIPEYINRHLLYHDVDKLREKYYTRSLNEINLADSINEFMQLALKYRMRLPSQLTLLGKALVTVEGVGRQLDPNLQVAEIARPLGTRLFRERLSLGNWKKIIRNNLLAYHRLITNLPQDLTQLIDIAKRGELEVKIQRQEQDYILRKLSSLINRLILSIILAALIIATPLLFEYKISIYGNFSLAKTGLVFEGILFLLLLFSLIRGRRGP